MSIFAIKLANLGEVSFRLLRSGGVVVDSAHCGLVLRNMPRRIYVGDPSSAARYLVTTAGWSGQCTHGSPVWCSPDFGYGGGEVGG